MWRKQSDSQVSTHHTGTQQEAAGVKTGRREGDREEGSERYRGRERERERERGGEEQVERFACR